jgi:hypothetical protein
MIGVRVSYIHNGQLKSWNLAVRVFHPNLEEMDSGKTASELIVQWRRVILHECTSEWKHSTYLMHGFWVRC